jgi:hypothetical protein
MQAFNRIASNGRLWPRLIEPGEFPRRPEGETRSSERDLVVAVDQLGVLVFG